MGLTNSERINVALGSASATDLLNRKIANAKAGSQMGSVVTNGVENDLVRLEVSPSVSKKDLKDKKYSKKNGSQKDAAKITEATVEKEVAGKDAVEQTTQTMSGKNFKKRSRLKTALKAATVVVFLASALFAGKHFLNSRNVNPNDYNKTSITQKANLPYIYSEGKAYLNGGYDANDVDVMYNQMIAHGIEYYNKTGKIMDSKDILQMYVGMNAGSISADTYTKLGLQNHITADGVVNSVQEYGAMSKQLNDAGLEFNHTLLSRVEDDKTIEYLESVRLTNGQTSEEVNKTINNTEYAAYSSVSKGSRAYINVIAYNIPDQALINLGEGAAECKNAGKAQTGKYDNNLTDVRNEIEGRINVAALAGKDAEINLNDLLMSANIEIQKYAMEHKIEEVDLVALINERIQKTINKDATVLNDSNSVDAAVKNGATVNEKNKTINLNPGKTTVKDKVGDTTTTYHKNDVPAPKTEQEQKKDAENNANQKGQQQHQEEVNKIIEDATKKNPDKPVATKDTTQEQKDQAAADKSKETGHNIEVIEDTIIYEDIDENQIDGPSKTR